MSATTIGTMPRTTSSTGFGSAESGKKNGTVPDASRTVPDASRMRPQKVRDSPHPLPIPIPIPIRDLLRDIDLSPIKDYLAQARASAAESLSRWGTFRHRRFLDSRNRSGNGGGG